MLATHIVGVLLGTRGLQCGFDWWGWACCRSGELDTGHTQAAEQ
jgi:hypothetical protein